MEYLSDSDLDGASSSSSISASPARLKKRTKPARVDVVDHSRGIESDEDSSSSTASSQDKGAAPPSTPGTAAAGSGTDVTTPAPLRSAGEGGAGPSTGKASSGRPRYFSGPDWSVKCFNCNKRGHMSGECPNPPAPQACFLCGDDSGHHKSNACPHRMCYNCGGQGHDSRRCPAKDRASSGGRGRHSFAASLGRGKGYLGGAEEQRGILQQVGPLGVRAPLPTQHGAVAGVSQEFQWCTALLMGLETPDCGAALRMARQHHGKQAAALEDDLSKVTCAACGQRGHAVCGVAQLRHAAGWAPTARPTIGLLQADGVGRSGCSNCGSDEHWEHACTLPRFSVSARLFRDGQVVNCHLCGEEGHLMMHCPQQKRRARSSGRGLPPSRGRAGGGAWQGVSYKRTPPPPPQAGGGEHDDSSDHDLALIVTVPNKAAGKGQASGAPRSVSARRPATKAAYYQNSVAIAEQRAEILAGAGTDSRRKKKLLQRLKRRAKLSGEAQSIGGDDSSRSGRSKRGGAGKVGGSKRRRSSSPSAAEGGGGSSQKKARKSKKGPTEGAEKKKKKGKGGKKAPRSGADKPHKNKKRSGNGKASR